MGKDQQVTLYKISKVKDPMLKDNAFMQAATLPLEEQHVELVAKDIDWSDFVWGECSL